MAKRAKRKKSRKGSIIIGAIAVILVLVIITAVVLYVVKPEIYHKYLGVGEHTWNADGICAVCGLDGNDGTEQGAKDSEFSVHIIDLGKNAGDSIYIRASGNDILIDAGATGASAPLICSYLDKYVTDGKLEYVIATHADSDHISAFTGSSGSGSSRTGVLYNYKVGTLIRFDNITEKKSGNVQKPNTEIGRFFAALDYLESNGTSVYTAGQCYYEQEGAKRQYFLDDGKTLSMNILYNYYYYNVSDDENNHSVVTLFTKTTSNGSFNWLFTGDLEKDGESRLVDYYSDSSNSKSEYDVLPDVDFYKAGHHGSGTSSSEKLLNVIKPEYVGISCCAGAPEYTAVNDNTFPYTAVFGNLLKHTRKIYCTSVAKNLPSLGSDGKFDGRSYDFEPCNGTVITYFNSMRTENGVYENVKVWCTDSQESVIDTDWYKKYRESAV